MYSARPIEQEDHSWASPQLGDDCTSWATGKMNKKIKHVHIYKYTGNAKGYYVQAKEISDFLIFKLI